MTDGSLTELHATVGPRSMPPNGFSASNGTETVAAATGPCSAAAVSRTSCTRTASKSADGSPR